MIGRTFGSSLREIKYFAHAIQRKFVNEYEAANSPTLVEELLDFVDRAQEEVDTGRPVKFRQQDAALLVSTRRNLRRSVPPDLDLLSAEALQNANYLIHVASAVQYVQSIVLERLEKGVQYQFNAKA